MRTDLPRRFRRQACLRSQRVGGCPAFTLLELLVVITVVAVLVALTLPALQQARTMGEDVTCRSNLRSMQMGWSMSLEDYDGVIPRTVNTGSSVLDWVDVMEAVYPEMPLLNGARSASFNVCPTALNRYSPMFAFHGAGRWGYAINTWWSTDAATEAERLNEEKPWEAIRSPSRYPWFMDSEFYSFFGGAYNAVGWAPHTPSIAQKWGVGGHHRNGEAFNSSFADGSVQSVSMSVIDEINSSSDFHWFENR